MEGRLWEQEGREAQGEMGLEGRRGRWGLM